MYEVVKITNSVVLSENKQAFMDMVALEYDNFSAQDENGPVFATIVFVGEDGGATCQWLGRKSSVDKIAVYLSRALTKLQTTVWKQDK